MFHGDVFHPVHRLRIVNASASSEWIDCCNGSRTLTGKQPGGVGRTENHHGRDVQGRGDMGRAAVIADDKGCLFEQGNQLRQGCAAGQQGDGYLRGFADLLADGLLFGAVAATDFGSACVGSNLM